MKNDSTFRTTIKNETSQQSDLVTDQDTLNRIEKIKRITSNLPEVYNKYFFTVADQEKERAGDQMNLTSPGLRLGF